MTSASRSIWHRLLEGLGLELPPLPPLPPVERRPWLAYSLDLATGARRLPRSYCGLFCAGPVDDPNRLLGREQELAGLSEAAARWKSGYPASVLVSGIQGSGKTSLINCAIRKLFAGETVVRGELKERWQHPADVYEFLHRLVGLAPEGDLSAHLMACRRVLVLEGIEHSYLRTNGGFAALDEFLDILQATSHYVLWIVSVNEMPRRLLDAVLHFQEVFSHQIHVMGVSRDTLKSSILQRHQASGLALAFVSKRPQRERFHRLEQRFGWRSPERAFFDAIHRQSEGVFQSAFDLWLDSIESMEAGTVSVPPLHASTYQALRDQLEAADLHILMATAQHGGLTVNEAATVFAAPAADCQRRMERLRDLGLIWLEPHRQEYSICRPAISCARDLLEFYNLWE